MPAPKKKISKMKRDKRRTHQSLDVPGYSRDSKTGELHRPHRAFKDSEGNLYYAGKVIQPGKVKQQEA